MPKILILGDSLSTGTTSPGGVLGAKLRASGYDVAVNGKVSRSAVNFWSGTNGENGAAVVAGLAAARPDIVIVMLGTNDLGLNATADQAAFARIAAAFNGAELWAVGPPAFARADLTNKAPAVYETLVRVFGRGRVIDWRPLTADIVSEGQGRSKDGVHFARLGAAVAGGRLADAWLRARGDAPAAPPPAAGVAWWPVPAAAAAAAVLIAGVAWVMRRRRLLGVVKVDAVMDDSDPDRRAFMKATADSLNAAARRLDKQGKSVGALTKKVYLDDLAKAVGVPLARIAPMLFLFQRRGWIELQRRDLGAGQDVDLVDASTIEHDGTWFNMLVVPT